MLKIYPLSTPIFHKVKGQLEVQRNEGENGPE